MNRSVRLSGIFHAHDEKKVRDEATGRIKRKPAFRAVPISLSITELVPLITKKDAMFTANPAPSEQRSCARVADD